MAVIHIPESETALSLSDLIAMVRAGEDVRIDSGSESFALVSSVRGFPVGWTVDDAIRQSEARGSHVLLDDKFGDDMEEIMRFNRLRRKEEPWE
jgi:hypothetical protein